MNLQRFLPARPSRLALICLAVIASGSALPGEAAPAPGPATLATLAPVDPAQGSRYIVELVDEPLATHDGSRPAPPTLDGGARSQDAAERIDLDAPAARAYAARLDARQEAFLDALQPIAPGARSLYRYRIAFNGLTVRLTPEQAAAARRLPGVRGITREEPVIPLMDASLPRIGAPEAWADPRVGGRAEAGRGQRIAIIDSGITAAHPFFDDQGSSAPEGFPRATLRIGERVLEYRPEQIAAYTNGKVIVARSYVNPELVDPADSSDPLDTWTPLADGLGGFHGAHVAGAAAGSIRSGAPGSSQGSLDLSGVAPGAWLMSYKFTSAYTPEILAMIDDAVADGADVINNSWGSSAMNVLPADGHPVARAFEAAVEAGVVVVAAAGNAGGNGESTLGGPHQMSPRVITVANSQTGRGFAWKLHAADEGLPEALTEHATAYEAFEQDFGRIDKPAVRIADFCNPIGLAFGAIGRIVLEPLEGSCPIPGLDLPVPIPDTLGWLTKLLLAGVANATAPATIVESIVFYGPEGDPETLVGLLGFLDQLAPLFEQFGLEVEFPIVAIITGPDALALAEWADGHPSTLRLTLDSTPQTTYDPQLDDAAEPTSSQGPVPRSLLAPRSIGTLKPDLSAPGTDLVSASTDAEGAPDGFVAATGTSMSSPQVAGAAAVLRQAHPDWTPEDVHAALLVTASPSVTVDGAPAPATIQGAGRLDLARAIDPGLLVYPPSVDLRLAAGDELSLDLRLRDVRRAPDAGITYAIREEPSVGPRDGQPVFELAPDARLALGAGAAVEMRLRTATAGLPAGSYDGWIVFEEAESASQRVRLRYRVELTGERRDVLLIDVRRRSTEAGGLPGIPGLPGLPGGGFEDTPDHSRHWLAALDEAGLGYDHWIVGTGAEAGGPPLSVLQRYDLVVLAAGEGDAPLDRLPGGMTSLQMYLLGGGRLLVSGHAWRHQPSTADLLGLQNDGAMYLLSRYFAGFELLADEVSLDETRDRITPVRLFDRPIRLARSASAAAAGNGGTVDLGRPLAALQTRAADGGAPGGGGAPAPDLGIAAPLAVERVMPYMRSYLEVDGRGSLMTGVSGDASLETPLPGQHIPWRALFASFAIEAVEPAPGSLSRAELLADVHRWATEPDDLRIELRGPAALETGQRATFTAELSNPSGLEVVAWRWDRGDGRGFVGTREPELAVTWMRPGRHALRAEATTAGGHGFVGTLEVEVTGPSRIFLPLSARSAAGAR